MTLQHFRRSLADRRPRRASPLTRVGATVKYLIRSAQAGKTHAAWLAFIYNSALMQAILAHDPRLIDRAQHHYINRRLQLTQRYAVIRDHYTMVLAAFPASMIEEISEHGQFRLGTIQLKDGSMLGMELRRPTGRGREGELCLCLVEASGLAVSSVIFSVADGGRSLLIGCMQGADASLGREPVRELTKLSHGLRPKNLLLSLLRAFASRFGISQLKGVANAAHPFAGQADKIKADYDSFWLECEGVPDNEGFYTMPVAEPERDEMLVVSKHRSAFRQREALRREASATLQAAFD